MNHLLDLEAKLAILAGNPCACAVCKAAAQLARRALRDVSPTGTTLLGMPQGTPEFELAERIFHDEEIRRLRAAYEEIDRGRCEMLPPPKLDTPSAPVDAMALPDPEQYRDKIEHYRKHNMKPRMVHRRTRIEMQNNPRVPGSYWIKT